MIPQQTEEANPEQLLKLLETQVAEARSRRTVRETGRVQAGTLGLFLVVGLAAVALGMLLMLLEHMRPQQAERNTNGGVSATEPAR